MTDRETQDLAALDALFDRAREVPVPDVSDALMARILADADTAQTAPEPAPVRSIWREWLAALGGWPAMGGLVAAGVTGLWIGAAPTGVVMDVMAGMLGETVTVNLFPEFDDLGLEAEG